MRTITDMASFQKKRRPVVLAAGFFDGVHRGHRRVIEHTRRRARDVGGQAWLLTFDTHPLRVLNPPAAPLLLTSNRHKLRLLRGVGLDGCLLLPFTRDLAALEPAAFVQHLAGHMPTLHEIVVGRNWRFGHRGTGDVRVLRRLARQAGFRVTVVTSALQGGAVVSSTRIRNAVNWGHLDEAAALLGRPFSVLGTVVRGRSLARRLGYPTANLDPHNEVLPPLGVYAVRATLNGRRHHDGVLSFGVRPTFPDADPVRPVLELHLFDMHADLYGRDIEVAFIARIRDELTFPSPAALGAQIAHDVATARTLL